jgi:hypothetical protein
MGSSSNPLRNSAECRREVNRIYEEVKKRRIALRKAREWNKENNEKDVFYFYQWVRLKCNQKSLKKSKSLDFWGIS